MFNIVENLGERTQSDNMCGYIALKVEFVHAGSMLTTWCTFVKHLEFRIKKTVINQKCRPITNQ